MKLKEIKDNLTGQHYFLLIMFIIYVAILFINPELFAKTIGFFVEILIKIIPVFVFVFALMALTNYFITPKFLAKHFKEKGLKKWIFAIIGGILSTGPIYMWYPLLADLKKKGLDSGIIACFLYNRAIKLALLPIAIFYFGLKFVVILSFVMILASIVQAKIINKLEVG